MKRIKTDRTELMTLGGDEGVEPTSRQQTEFEPPPSWERITIVFDGGAKPNFAYGSFKVMEWKSTATQRREYPNLSTSNEAELTTALEALDYVRKALAGPKFTHVTMKGDSMLAIECLGKRWKCRAPHLRPIVEQFWLLQEQIGKVSLVWQSRKFSVAILGH